MWLWFTDSDWVTVRITVSVRVIYSFRITHFTVTSLSHSQWVSKVLQLLRVKLENTVTVNWSLNKSCINSLIWFIHFWNQSNQINQSINQPINQSMMVDLSSLCRLWHIYDVRHLLVYMNGLCNVTVPMAFHWNICNMNCCSYWIFIWSVL